MLPYVEIFRLFKSSEILDAGGMRMRTPELLLLMDMTVKKLNV